MWLLEISECNKWLALVRAALYHNNCKAIYEKQDAQQKCGITRNNQNIVNVTYKI